MIRRYGPCWLITLFRFMRWKLEVGYAPAGYSVPAHSHPNASCEFTVIYSKHRRIWRQVGNRIDEHFAIIPKSWLKVMTVRPGVTHGFDAGKSPMLWLVLETWVPGSNVTSVAEDFQLQ